MRDDLRHLDLTFPAIPVSAGEKPHSLRRLLYDGGSSIRADQVDQAIDEGLLGDAQQVRIELVRLSHEWINGNLAGGGSPETARRQIANLTVFVGWADKVGAALNITEVTKTYIDWTEHLLQRARVVKDLKTFTAYNQARLVGQILDGALGRVKPIIGATRLKRPPMQKPPQGSMTDKQNLHTTFAFGRLLQDICDGIPLSALWGGILVRIPLQQGGEIEFKSGRWSSQSEDVSDPSSVRRSSKSALAYDTDLSVNHRFRRELINLRIQAELLMFIGQTGMNLAQAARIPLSRFSYSTDIEGYKVRGYKPRRKGEVLFEIFSEYRGHFERYLEWRRELFSDAEKRLFPIMRRKGIREDCKLKFEIIKKACRNSKVTWTPPSTLRGTRVNWLLRRSGDPDITAEMAQHHERTLLTVYEVPSQQRAINEIIRFHLKNDPVLACKAQLLAVGPGECDGIPKTSPAKPETAPGPDCLRASGCLWCEHHRDIDSLDYVWALACFRHLKILELSQILPTSKESDVMHPAEHTIERLTEKLFWFRDSNKTRREWVEESLARVEEEYYHDNWSYLIEAMEGASKC